MSAVRANTGCKQRTRAGTDLLVCIKSIIKHTHNTEAWMAGTLSMTQSMITPRMRELKPIVKLLVDAWKVLLRMKLLCI